VNEKQKAMLDDVQKKMASVIRNFGDVSQGKIFDEVLKGMGVLRALDEKTANLYLKMAWNELKGESELDYRIRIASIAPRTYDTYTKVAVKKPTEKDEK
jgi:hypothetical protein